MFRIISVIMTYLMISFVFADNLAMQEQIELQNSLNSTANTAVDSHLVPALSSNTSNVVGSELDSSNSNVDNAKSELNSAEQETKLQGNEYGLHELSEASSKNNVPIFVSGSNSTTIQQALVINQGNQLSKINDSQQAVNTQQTNDTYTSNKQASAKSDLKLKTELNIDDVALNYCTKAPKECIKELHKD